jgi:SAM-dependent methyltransferase
MSRAPYYPLKGWNQIEDAADVDAVRRRIAGLPRLDVYDAPDLYDLAYPGFKGDGEFYGKLIAADRVLYLGVGTGRLFSDMAANPQAVGLDYSAEMLHTLRQRHPNLDPGQILLGDALDPDACAPASFDHIIAPYCFLTIFDGQQVAQVLRNVRAWLKPGGTFTTDAFSPFVTPFLRPGLETITFPVDEHAIAIYIEYDHVRQAMHETAIISGPEGEWATDMDLHYHFPFDLTRYFVEAGLGKPSFTGEYTDEAFDPSRHEVMVVSGTRAD